MGLFEITFSGGGSQPLSVTARPVGLHAQALTDQPAVSLTPLARADFDQGGRRNLQATMEVSNTSGTPLTNLTFLAVSTPNTIAGTPISTLQRFDGSGADPAIASQIKPSQPKSLEGAAPVVTQRVALFQAYPEAAVSAVSLPRPSGVSDIFPYGFVAAMPGTGARTLPAGSTTGQVTFSFDLPLQRTAQADPFNVSVMVAAYTDTLPAATQTPDELDTAGSAAAVARISALQAQFPNTPVLLNAIGCPVGGSPFARRIPAVRTAGPAGTPTAMLGAGGNLLSLLSLSPDPYTASSTFLPNSSSFTPTFDQALVDATGFTVRGLQSGQLTGGSGTARQGGRPLFAGEEVEQVLTSGLTGQTNGGHLCAPVVSRFRIKTQPEGAAGFGRLGTYGLRSVRATALGDMNGDGWIDAVTAADFDTYVSVQLSQAGQSFGPQVEYAVGGQPTSVAPGDVNGDGRPDIVAAIDSSSALAGAGSVSVLLGQADGTFAPQVEYAVGLHPTSVALGDVNGDGRLDTVTANAADNTVSVLLGQAGGTFAPQVAYAVGGAPSGVALGDLNGDGRLDIVTSNASSNTVSVLLGQAGGTFAAQAAYAVGGAPSGVALGDLNGDGRPDIVTSNASSNSNNVSVLLGQGGGTFAHQEIYAVGYKPSGVALGDVNGDGQLDIVAPNNIPPSAPGTTTYYSTASLLLGQGGGTFAPQVTYRIEARPTGVTLGDVNGDGRLDVVITASFMSVLIKN
ncbi:hypothetical protein GCM10008957_30600 [Deinococcus ruber]|uniref:FG-GAP repeat protein n=1 Tax=Deinococcus ruber TaxID=1848197 RepID=A0A918FA46_9DEIO|nr:hypothetical protein GCM10008957_30600 [Deinococcus ruber]